MNDLVSFKNKDNFWLLVLKPLTFGFIMINLEKLDIQGLRTQQFWQRDEEYDPHTVVTNTYSKVKWELKKKHKIFKLKILPGEVMLSLMTLYKMLQFLLTDGKA